MNKNKTKLCVNCFEEKESVEYSYVTGNETCLECKDKEIARRKANPNLKPWE